MLMQVAVGFFVGFGFVSVFVVYLRSSVRLCFSLLKGLVIGDTLSLVLFCFNELLIQPL
jgi:hypothetical protein